MNVAKKFLTLMLALMMLVSCLPTAVFAAGGETNLTYKLSATEVNVGDEVSVTIGVKEMEVSSFACGIDFDESMLEVTKLTGVPTLQYEYYDEDLEDYDTMKVPTTSYSTIEEANNDGHVGAVWAGSTPVSYDKKATLVKITFTATAAGTVNITVFEDSSGPDACKQNPVGTLTLTIKGSEPEPPAHECKGSVTSYEKGENGKHIKVEKCECGETVNSTTEACSGGAADCENAAVCEFCGNTYIAAKGHGKTNGFHYSHVDGTNTHDVICADCKKTVEENVACTFEDGSHVCKFCDNETECSDAAGDKDHDCDVCGKPGITQCSDAAGDENHDCDVCGKEDITDHNYGDDFVCDECAHKLVGWQQKDGAWYYVNDDGKAVTGTVRVPYPTVAINGKTYGPNAEDVAYSQNNADSKYTDAETAMFMFGDDGKFDYTTNGLVEDLEAECQRYAVDGVIVWHVGLVEINGEYYYFAGDVNGGGNIMVTGKVYASRNTTGFEIVAGGIYYFGEDGKMCQYEGIVEIGGKKFYFENNRLMIGAGLIKVDGGYIYVRHNGQIAIGKYWVTNHNGITSSGMYTFDENGYLQGVKDPTVNGLKDGVYYKNGMPYFAGLIEIDGVTYYINSSGKAVTGTYYITKLDNYTGSLNVQRGDKLTFAADGKLVTE